jgi:hypothetical protein
MAMDRFDLEAEREGIAIGRKNLMTPHTPQGWRLGGGMGFSTMKTAEKFSKNPKDTNGRIIGRE